MKEVKRPWGNFKEFVKNKKSTVKILEVKPDSMLSLQKHKHRDEMWYFLTPGFVQLGEKSKPRRVKKGDIVNIPKTKAHRLMSKKSKVVVLEVSLGKFSENDEIRIEDKYGRR